MEPPSASILARLPYISDRPEGWAMHDLISDRGTAVDICHLSATTDTRRAALMHAWQVIHTGRVWLVARPVVDERLISACSGRNAVAVRADNVIEQVPAVDDLKAEGFPDDWLAALDGLVCAGLP
jgi:hypothetical protein